MLFFKKEKGKQSIFFFNIWKKILWRKNNVHITLSQCRKCFAYAFYLSVCNFQVAFSLQRIFRWRISITRTYKGTTQTHTIIFICYGTGRRLPVNMYYFFFFLVAFIRYMQYEKSNSLVDIGNLSKIKFLSRIQALNKNSSNSKK